MHVFGLIVASAALFALLQCKVNAGLTDKYFEEIENGESMENFLRYPRSFYPEGSFMAGELTPVWVAHAVNSLKVTYEKLESGIVKKAMDYYKSRKFRGFLRGRRDINKNITVTTKEVPGVIPLGSKKVEKEQFFYPSLLVTMEYYDNWPSSAEAQEKFIFNKILYALAYWNEIDIQLRPVRYPAVRIRIAGIIIARNKDVTPARTKNIPMGIRLIESFHNAMRYWTTYREENKEFGKDTFNVLAAMTDTKPVILSSYGTSTSSANCYGQDHIYKVGNFSGLMVYDDHYFSGITQTVAEIAHILGRVETGVHASMDAAQFISRDLARIRSGIKVNATCWAKPLEGNPPGKPIETILREDILMTQY